MISYMISYSNYIWCLCSCAAADLLQAHPADAIDLDSGHDDDREMDFDEERDFADQGPLSDMDMEEDAQILATLQKHIPSCMNAADIEQLLQDIPDQQPVVVPARTVREAVEAGDLPPLDRDAQAGAGVRAAWPEIWA